MSFAGNYAGIPLTLVSYVVIARLLTPEEIGIYSVAAALIGFAQVLRDFGIGNFLVQERQLTEEHVSSALGVSLVLGGVLFMVFMLGAPLAGMFYSSPRIVPIVKLIAINFLLLPFCSISLSLLKRSMQFGRIAIANFCGGTVGVATTLSLAWHGWGPASLAWGALVTNATTGLTAWFMRTDHKLLLPTFSKWRSVVHFGGQSALGEVVTSIAIDINDIAIGRILGFTSVAMLSRAQGVMNLFHQQFMSAVTAVAYPAFAQANRNGDNTDTNFVTSITNVTVFAWPFYGMVALYPLEILRLVFGPQWDAASSLVPIFSGAGAIAATYTLIVPWMMAAGRIDLVTRGQLIAQPLRVAAIVGAALLFKTLLACALAFLTSFAIAMVIFYTIKARSMVSDFRALRLGLLKSASVSLCCLLIPSIIAVYSGFGRSEPIALPMVISAVLAAFIVWVCAVLAFRHPIAKEDVFRQLFGAPTRPR